MLEALVNLYEEIGFEDVLADIRNDYLTEHTARNGRTVLWYLDDMHNVAIYTDNCNFLTEEEIENELC